MGAYLLQVNEGALDLNWSDTSLVTDVSEYSALYYQTLVVSSSSSFAFWLHCLEDPSVSYLENQKQHPSCHQFLLAAGWTSTSLNDATRGTGPLSSGT